MTVSSETSRAEYTGAGTTGPFAFPYYFLEDNDLVVIKRTIATGVEETLVLTTDYTIAGAADPAGGSVTTVVAIAATHELVIFRDPNVLQETDYVDGDSFPASSHERALDKLTMIMQRVKNLVTRSLRLSDGDTTGDGMTLPVDRASKYLAFDADGNPVATAGTTSAYVVTPFMETVLDDTTAAAARATLEAVPQGSSTGGNARGTQAVDLQLARASATEVASGAYSVVAGGMGNKATGSMSAVAGGQNNTASGSFSLAGGLASTASGSNSTALSGGTASASTAVAMGSNCLANAINSMATGSGADVRSVYGKNVRSIGSLSGNVGNAQRGETILLAATTDATPEALTADQAAAGATNQLVLANNQAMVVRGQVLCRRSVAQADEASGWEFTAVIRRGANAATTALVAAVVPTLIAQDAALAATVVAVTADTTNGALAVTVTGIAATNLYWMATLHSTELVYA